MTRLAPQLAGDWRAAAPYPSDHPAIHTPLRELATGLAMVLRTRDKVTLGMVGEFVRLSTNAVDERVGRSEQSSELDTTAPRVELGTNANGVVLPEPIDRDLSTERAGGRVTAGIADPVRKGIDVVRVLGL